MALEPSALDRVGGKDRLLNQMRRRITDALAKCGFDLLTLGDLVGFPNPRLLSDIENETQGSKKLGEVVLGQEGSLLSMLAILGIAVEELMWIPALAPEDQETIFREMNNGNCGPVVGANDGGACINPAEAARLFIRLEAIRELCVAA